MELTRRAPIAAAEDDGRRFVHPPSHGDQMMEVRDALLSQLQMERLRQDIIVAELAKIERAVALPGHLQFTLPLLNETMPDQKPNPPSTWTCVVCRVHTTSERNLREHCGGQKHLSNVATLESRTKAKAKTTAEPFPGAEQKTPPTADQWNCTICQVICTGVWDLDIHLKGKKHQAKVQALLEESKNMVNNSESLKARLLPNSPATLAMSSNPSTQWGCSICQAKCVSEFQYEQHCGSRKHQQKLQERKKAKASGLNKADRHTVLYICKICHLGCYSQEMLENHLSGKKHSKAVKQKVLLNFCDVCDLQCNSVQMLAEHRAGKKHQAKLNEKK